MRRAPALVLSLVFVAALSTPASAYELLGFRWPIEGGPSEFALEPEGSADVDDGSDLQAVRDAFRSWACVEGQGLRFVEGDEPGVKVADRSDEVNSIYWDEVNDFGFGPGTFATTVTPGGGGPDGEIEVREGADIIFNGFDYTWATDPDVVTGGGGVDVQSVAVHEIGHWLGLAHPCDGDVCLGLDESIMTPTSPSDVVARDLQQDDIDGLLELYATDDGSRCDGPYRLRERCTCNDDCVEGLLCADIGAGEQVCSQPCTLEDTSVCSAGQTCALRPAPGGAVGLCVAVSDTGQLPPGALCENDRQCQSDAICGLTDPLGRTACRLPCDSIVDCPDGTDCTQGICTVLGIEGVACPSDEPPPACGCRAAGERAPRSIALAALLLALIRLRRRESRNRRHASPLG